MNHIEKVLFSEDIEDCIKVIKDDAKFLHIWVDKAVSLNKNFKDLPEAYQKLFSYLLPDLFSIQSFRRFFLLSKWHELICKKKKIKNPVNWIKAEKTIYDLPTFENFSKQHNQNLNFIENELRHLCYAIILELRHHKFLNFSSQYLLNFTKKKFEFSKDIIKKLMTDYNDFLIKHADYWLKENNLNEEQKKLLNDIKHNDLYKIKDLNLLLGDKDD